MDQTCSGGAMGAGWGTQADPLTTIQVIEAISAADGATGWALMIGMETVGIGGSLMAPETAGVYLALANGKL